MQALNDFKQRGVNDHVTKDLRPIYTAIDADQALLALEAFQEKWGQQMP